MSPIHEWQTATSLAKLLVVARSMIYDQAKSGHLETRPTTADERIDHSGNSGPAPLEMFRVPFTVEAEPTPTLPAWVPASKRLTIVPDDEPASQTGCTCSNEIARMHAHESALIEHIDDLHALVDRLRGELGARRQIRIKLGPFKLEVSP